MLTQRRLHILSLFRRGNDVDVGTKRLGEVCAEATATDGASIMLLDKAGPLASICTTGGASKRLEELQHDLGEGPAIDAHNQGEVVFEPDLVEPATERWMAFRGPAVAAGVGAVFALPLRVGGARLGAMTLYNSRSGDLSDDQHANALVMADIAAHAVLLLQANAPPDMIEEELAAGADFHHLVHQAAGMVAAQLDAPIDEALIRLRAHAFGNQRALTDVASDVVNRTLRFQPDNPEHAPTDGDSTP